MRIVALGYNEVCNQTLSLDKLVQISLKCLKLIKFGIHTLSPKKKSIIPNINFRPDSFPYNSDVKKLKREESFKVMFLWPRILLQSSMEFNK